MSIKLSDSIRVGQQKPLEDKYFNELVPYTSTSQVNTLIPKAVRHIGLTVNINREEYWYKDGIEDSNLVPKITNYDLKNQEQDSRLENLEGINYTWSPTNRVLTLFDNSGNQLSQVSLVSLDNEGTDLRYNASTLSLELYNIDNELLDSIPVSSFIGSVGTQLHLNSNQLQLKDSQGNILSTVTFEVSNIGGLQTALDGKQDVLTEDNVGQFMDLELATKSTPTSGDTVLGRDSLTGKAVEIPTSSLGGNGNVDTSNLVPYDNAYKDVNIGGNYFKTSKGFDFTLDENNYFRTSNDATYTNIFFKSNDTSYDNFGSIFLMVNPDEGFHIQKINDNGIYNNFRISEYETYSSKPFVSEGGFKTTTGTANQALTANGGVYDLTTKADLVDGKVPQSQSQGSNLSLDYTTNTLSLTDASGAEKNVYLNKYEEVLIKTYSPTFDPSIDPLVGKFWFNITNGKLYYNQGLMWQGQYQLITTSEKNNYYTAYTHSQTTGNPHNTTKSDIGLGNVENTSDLNKPISTATQNALNTKADIDDIPTKTSFTYDILVSNWTLVSGKYEAVISNAGILSNSFIDVIPSNDNVDIVRNAQIYPSVLISEGSVKVYSKFLPSGTISVTVNIN